MDEIREIVGEFETGDRYEVIDRLRPVLRERARDQEFWDVLSKSDLVEFVGLLASYSGLAPHSIVSKVASIRSS